MMDDISVRIVKIPSFLRWERNDEVLLNLFCALNFGSGCLVKDVCFRLISPRRSNV